MSLIAIVTNDLFLAAKVQALLAPHGLDARRVAPGAVASLAAPPAAVVLDLGLPPQARGEVAAWADGRLPVLAFGAHVDRDATAWARQAGFHAVLTKGQLSARLADALTSALGLPPS